MTSGLYLHTSSYSFKLVHKCHLSYRATSHFRFKLAHERHWSYRCSVIFRFKLAHGRHLSYRSICFLLQVGAWAPFVVSLNLFSTSSWRMGTICPITQFICLNLPSLQADAWAPNQLTNPRIKTTTQPNKPKPIPHTQTLHKSKPIPHQPNLPYHSTNTRPPHTHT